MTGYTVVVGVEEIKGLFGEKPVDSVQREVVVC